MLMVLASVASAQTTVPAVKFTIDPSPKAPPFVGFGAQFNGWLYCKPNWGNVTEENVKDCEKKTIDLAPQHVRIFVEVNDKSPQQRDPQIHESVMRTIDLAQRAGATVNLTLWHGPYEPRDGAERMTRLIDEAINKRKLTAVQYVTLQNEPNSFNMDKTKYNALYREFDAALKRANLRDKIKIIGGDLLAIEQAAWFKNLGDNLADVCDGYSVHMYSDYWETEKLLKRVGEITDVANSLPKDQQKPIYLTEFGFRGHRKNLEEPGFNDDRLLLSADPMLGVLLGWRMIDALDHGWVTMLFWDAYAVMYDRNVMPYGFIGEPQDGWPLRPHYHLMRIFTHTAKPGWHALGVDGATDEQRVAAMSGTSNEFTIYAVNRSKDARDYSIDGAPVNAKFTYLIWNADGKGTVKASPEVSSDSAGKIIIRLAPQTVIALSTDSRY